MDFRRFGYSFIRVLARLALGSCAHPEGHKDLLAFLRDGRTTKDEVETRIGPASVRGDGRLWTYRVGEAAESFYLSANRSRWSDARQTSPFVSAASSGGKAPIPTFRVEAMRHDRSEFDGLLPALHLAVSSGG